MVNYSGACIPEEHQVDFEGEASVIRLASGSLYTGELASRPREILWGTTAPVTTPVYGPYVLAGPPRKTNRFAVCNTHTARLFTILAARHKRVVGDVTTREVSQSASRARGYIFFIVNLR